MVDCTLAVATILPTIRQFYPLFTRRVARLNGETARSLEPRVVAQVNEVMEKREESVCCTVAGNKIVPSMHDE